MHFHNHCEHKNIKFCIVCNKPYCPDCGMEWTSAPNWFYKYSQWAQDTYKPIKYGDQIIPTVTCEHK